MLLSKHLSRQAVQFRVLHSPLVQSIRQVFACRGGCAKRTVCDLWKRPFRTGFEMEGNFVLFTIFRLRGITYLQNIFVADIRSCCAQWPTIICQPIGELRCPWLWPNYSLQLHSEGLRKHEVKFTVYAMHVWLFWVSNHMLQAVGAVSGAQISQSLFIIVLLKRRPT